MAGHIDRRYLTLLFLLASAAAFAQEPTSSAPDKPSPSAQDLPPIPQLVLDVESNEKAAEAAARDYTYHVHFQQLELDNSGNLKKTTTTDSESLTIDGVRIDRVVARDGKPLTPKEAQKESDHIDKEVAKAKERRAKLADKGHDTDSHGDEILTASRILELGSFSNPRRVDLDGRPTIVADYNGDPNAKTHTEFEKAFRDLVGTVWIDEQDRTLSRAQGHFLHDFKIGGGLVVDIKGGSSFEVRYAKINHEVWLPIEASGQGKIRFLLFTGFNGRVHLETSDYRKFRSTSTIIQSDRLIGPDGQPIPNPPPPQPPSTPSPQPHQP
jgi:hypothetical protein